MLSTPMDLFALFTLLAFFFCTVMNAVFAFHNRLSHLSNRLLFLLLLTFSATFLASFPPFQETANAAFVLRLVSGASLLVMPFAFLYLQKSGNKTWRKRDYGHFVPLLLFVVAVLVAEAGVRDRQSQQLPSSAFVYPAVAYFLRIIQWIVYSPLLFILLRNQLMNATRPAGRLEHGMNVVVSALIMAAIVPPVVQLQGFPFYETIFYSLLIAAAFVLCFVMLVNPGVLYGLPASDGTDSIPETDSGYSAPVEDEMNPDEIPQLRPKKISLSDQQVHYIEERLHQFMLIRKPFLHQKYTLQQLSSDSGFPLYQLSLYLNRTLGMNFNSYINKMRIEFLLESYKRTPEKWNRFTLEAIAREIGFSNRTSFIQAFKKNTGTNPSVYFRNMHGHILSDQ